ncbi:hypothetical protein KSP40_PGU010532 [Platanthera guangdongensis]|uniref:Uncharacterized protein n=1 Tax=Platanthera guangdongensis TaxID=2320717 RepID=A0ABR2LT89_9ASPA
MIEDLLSDHLQDRQIGLFCGQRLEVRRALWTAEGKRSSASLANNGSCEILQAWGDDELGRVSNSSDSIWTKWENRNDELANQHCELNPSVNTDVHVFHPFSSSRLIFSAPKSSKPPSTLSTDRWLYPFNSSRPYASPPAVPSSPHAACRRYPLRPPALTASSARSHLTKIRRRPRRIPPTAYRALSSFVFRSRPHVAGRRSSSRRTSTYLFLPSPLKKTRLHPPTQTPIHHPAKTHSATSTAPFPSSVRNSSSKVFFLQTPPKSKIEVTPVVAVDDLSHGEILDLEEIEELHGLTEISMDEIEKEKSKSMAEKEDKTASSVPDPPSFDLDLDSLSKSRDQISDPDFKMTLAELLDESRVVPVSVHGHLEVLITGIQHDPKEVSSGDHFIRCAGASTDGHDSLIEADRRGAVAAVADKEINLDETLALKALIIVEDTDLVLPVLAASFYGNPSRTLSVIGITGTHGKTSTAHLVKAMYEAMGLRTGMLSSLGYYIHGDNILEASDSTPDAVSVQKLMAKMVHNGTEAVVMETSSSGLSKGSCNQVDFDISVFTNLSKGQLGFHGTAEEYRSSIGKLFERMIDPERNRTPMLLISYVPVVSYAMEDRSAGVYPLKFDLSLFETQVLVQMPKGILEISSGLLGRHNIYNILAAVAVGIAVGAPLEDIVRGVEEVDAVPGRCELIDEEQAFGVVVDYARAPYDLCRLLDTMRELRPRRIITVDILDDMLTGVGWSMQDYLNYGENDYYPPLPNGHRLFLHDIRRVAVRAAVAMGEEADIVISQHGNQTSGSSLSWKVGRPISTPSRSPNSSCEMHSPSAFVFIRIAVFSNQPFSGCVMA